MFAINKNTVRVHKNLKIHLRLVTKKIVGLRLVSRQVQAQRKQLHISK
jgi:hypothetical protein